MKLNQLLVKPNYLATKASHSNHMQFECLFDYGNIITLFDELKEETGCIPSQSEYINAGLARAENFFSDNKAKYIYKTNSLYLFTWDDNLINAVKNRLARTYASYIIEEQIKEYLIDRQLTVYTDPLIDMNFGADLVIRQDDKVYYLHITKNSANARNILRQKANRTSYEKVNNKKIYWTRNWGEAHNLLLYNNIDSDRMQELNGNLLFSERYLDRFFEVLFNSNNFDILDGTSEIEQFLPFLSQCESTFSL